MFHEIIKLFLSEMLYANCVKMFCVNLEIITVAAIIQMKLCLDYNCLYKDQG